MDTEIDPYGDGSGCYWYAQPHRLLEYGRGVSTLGFIPKALLDRESENTAQLTCLARAERRHRVMGRM